MTARHNSCEKATLEHSLHYPNNQAHNDCELSTNKPHNDCEIPTTI
ncbi:40531_t:CDS:1, partial [Gigaspora margarita]